jgi:hypothetical protein
MKDAMILAKANIQTDNYFKEYKTQPDDSSYVVTVNLTIGHLFSNNQRHLLIRRQVPWCEYLDLYLITDNELKSVITREQGDLTYINDTIRDINGDGFNDFLVHWYPASGCCRRDVYNVYLNQSDKGTFTSDYKFINPTFSPTEKIIRGVEYGHPGEVGLYKYKWTGLQVDTIEHIYPDVNKKGQFIKTRKGSYRPTEKDGEILNAVPQEYQKIESYEWFSEF